MSQRRPMSKVPLCDVAPLSSDRVAPFQGTRQYLATGGLNGDDLPESESVTFESKPSRADLSVSPGDVIFARMQATEKVLQITDEHADLIVSTGFAVHRPDQTRLDAGYLAHFLRSPGFQHTKDRLCTGATQKAITNAGLDSLAVPIPEGDGDSTSVSIQRRIARTLDTADSIRRQRAESLRVNSDLLLSLFLDMFGDPAVTDVSWPTGPLSSHGEITTGNTPSRKQPEYYGNFIEWIKSDNINTPAHVVTRASEMLSEEGFGVCRWVPAGATLVTCIAGSPSGYRPPEDDR